MENKTEAGSVSELESSSRRVLCPVCEGIGKTKVRRDDDDGLVGVFLALGFFLTIIWCILCPWGYPKVAVHKCSVCGVQLLGYYKFDRKGEPLKILPSYVKNAMSAPSSKKTEKFPNMINDDGRGNSEKELHHPGIESPLRLQPPAVLPVIKNENTDLLREFTISGHFQKLGDFKITCSDQTYEYHIDGDIVPSWTAADRATRNSQTKFVSQQISGPIHGRSITIRRSKAKSTKVNETTITFDETAGSWALQVVTEDHSCCFEMPLLVTEDANGMEISSPAGPMFWIRHTTKLVMVDAYDRLCAEIAVWMKPPTLRVSPLLNVSVLDELIGIAVGVIVQCQRYDEWLMHNAHWPKHK